jgi:catechol 2,3-dioxygenase-like lactoylglutathione lyase family enzyme
MIIDHFGLGVADYEAAKSFYRRALAPLGIGLLTELEAADNGGVRAAGFGRAPDPEFWIGSDGLTTPRTHIAFVARTREEVAAFHAAALEAGGVDNGAPGLRPEYHAHYYAAFVRDLDGHNIEAVCHAPETA